MSEEIEVKPKSPHYAFQIFMGVMGIVGLQLITFQTMTNQVVDTWTKITTVLCVVIFGIQSLVNMFNERKNRGK